MRITILAIGSRGDVQPYVALGQALQKARHQVRIATHKEFYPLVQEHGIEFYLLEGDPRAILNSQEGQAWQKSAGSPLGFLTNLRRIAEPLLQKLTQDCLGACRTTDLILYSTLAFFSASAIGQKLHIPAIAAYVQPDKITRAFPQYRFPPAPAWISGGQGMYNRATYILMEQLYWLFLKKPVNETRRVILQTYPLKSAPHTQGINIYGYSRYVVPKPKDWEATDHVTGFWFLDRLNTWQPPTQLLDFLASGPPPVSVGFGSMSNRDPEQVTALVLTALQLSGQRGILLSGWGGLQQSDLPDTVLKLDEVPHDWLFPQVAATVHHGGCGTTAATFRAGIPMVGVPFFSDQPFWASRAHHLGVGTKPIPRKELSAEVLAAAITIAVTDPQLRRHAAQLGRVIRSEDGRTNAVGVLENYVATL